MRIEIPQKQWHNENEEDANEISKTFKYILFIFDMEGSCITKE